MTSDLSIFQPKVFSKFKNGSILSDGTAVDGVDFFVASISLTARAIAKEMFACDLVMNEDNMATARRYWMRDMKHIEIRREEFSFDQKDASNKSQSPNEFKQAGFLAYWLRRRMVVTKTWAETEDIVRHKKRYQDEFVKSSSETVAFLIGLYLCIYYRLQPSDTSTVPFDKVLQDAVPPFGYIMDAVNLMKNKNVSPHSIYLIYSSLFRPDPTEHIK